MRLILATLITILFALIIFVYEILRHIPCSFEPTESETKGNSYFLVYDYKCDRNNSNKSSTKNKFFHSYAVKELCRLLLPTTNTAAALFFRVV